MFLIFYLPYGEILFENNVKYLLEFIIFFVGSEIKISEQQVVYFIFCKFYSFTWCVIFGTIKVFVEFRTNGSI